MSTTHSGDKSSGNQSQRKEIMGRNTKRTVVIMNVSKELFCLKYALDNISSFLCLGILIW